MCGYAMQTVAVCYAHEQVQLLSHQTHIATKIELFLSKSSSLHDATFQRLGYDLSSFLYQLLHYTAHTDLQWRALPC